MTDGKNSAGSAEVAAANIARLIKRASTADDHSTMPADFDKLRAEFAAQTRTPTWLGLALSGATDPHIRDILLVGLDETLTVSAEDLQVFSDKYELDFPPTVGSGPSDTLEGIRWIVQFGPPGIMTTNVDDLNLAEPYRTIIGEEFERMKAEAGKGRQDTR